MHVEHGADSRNPQAPPCPTPILLEINFRLLGLSTSTLSNPQAHLPLEKSRLTHLDDLETLKLFTWRVDSEDREGTWRGLSLQELRLVCPSWDVEWIVKEDSESRRRREKSFYFPFSNSSAYHT